MIASSEERIVIVMKMLTDAANKGEACPRNDAIIRKIGAKSVARGADIMAKLERMGLISIERASDSRCVTILSTGAQTAPLRSAAIAASRAPRIQPAAPPSFRKLGPTMTTNAAAAHYKTHRDKISAWHLECGTWPLGRPKAVPIAKDRGRMTAQWGSQLTPVQGDSNADRAQRTLQYFYPCFRVKTRLPSDTSGDWFVDGRRMSEMDMLALAERKGRKAA